MKTRNVIWWLLFFPVGIMLQQMAPGLDALVIGLIILLQERSYKDCIWALPLFILLQEGMGSREFGGAVLWYAAVILFFNLGRWLFEVENFLFVFLLSACLGAAYFGLAYLLAPLQELHVDIQATLDASVIQALFIPVAWRLAAYSRGWVHAHDETA